ncbi:bifunctional acetate--CoA ligase family protein/GNAT family N-acetyltransferase [Aquabacterium sp. OR-4]|uniref:bifunctional acetate--CoA ligase family protein/GNAT family N-acetyltransferase n=1 Tax=Aquabacterium sp. OR-4 TaxID=2978127 RepID=UPI0021B27EB7|nr:bifunctional acetate--CoA ligase family protein/GNAT family N-acetyltransferase [Aquabacterium sp. OR-4]MDT7836764.1 bifunctional acetate--CoA ligase family protein/GNAT family N-acetyltransferase [Aquabacterium sp. OR-4]
MSIRNLDSLFDPASVVVVGASDRPGSLGALVWRNLRAAGYAGQLYAVNRRAQRLHGSRGAPGVVCHASVAALPAVPELAVLCTPPATLPGLIAELAAKGTRAAVVLTAGLDATQRQAMLDAARPTLLRILGPNGLGLQVPRLGLDASFAHTCALPGELAFVSQSGALVTAVLDWARGRGIGFSQVVSLGEHADVDFGDMLDWLASDAHTRAILLYIESVSAARKFMSAARAAARNKPVIVVKAGRSAPGQRAAASHSGALAGADEVVDAAIRRAGMLRVDTLDELFLAAETLARWRGNTADELLVLSNGGGAGVIAADAAAREGIPLAALAPATLARLDAVLPANWSHGNPVDIIGDAPVQRYLDTLDALATDPAAAALLFVHAPTAIVPSAEIAAALAPRLASAPGQPPRVLASWLGGPAVAEAQQRFSAAGIACYATPEEAVRAFAMGVAYRRNQAQLIETPPAALPAAAPGAPGAAADLAADVAAARAIVHQALAAGRTLLSEPEAKALLAAYRIPVVATRSTAATPQAAVAAVADGAPGALSYPVALKIISPQISHKSDVGGVVLDLADAEALRAAAQAMLQRVAVQRPDARITGLSVQQMQRWPQARELIVGASIDPVFGPVIVFGQGGTAVELLADRAIGLPPLNVPLARALVARTRVARLLGAWRDTPAIDEAALHATLLAVSQMLTELPELAELDINPLLADARGVVALDARVRLDAAGPAGAANFAILPYPQHWVELVQWQGRALTLRPIRPEDEAQHLAFLAALEPDDVRLRVFYSRRSIEHSELARLTQVDYAREIAFVATERDAAGQEQTLGAVRAVIDPDNRDAEFGIIVRSQLKGSGLGRLLMHKLMQALRERGTQRLVASVLRENQRMLALASGLGFVRAPAEAGADTVDIRLALG